MLRSLCVLVCVGGLQASTVTTFTDYAAWQAAILAHPGATLLTEDFSGNQLHVPGLSLTSQQLGGLPGNGSIQNNQWTDCVGANACGAAYDSTTLTLDTDGLIYGIWATYTTSQSVAGLEIVIPGTGVVALTGPPVNFGGYYGVTDYQWGFYSPTPFVQVQYTEDMGGVRFTIKDMQVGDPPKMLQVSEPVYTLLIGSALVLLGLWGKRRSAQHC